MSASLPTDPHPYRESEDGSAAFATPPWFMRKRTVRLILVLEVLCAATVLAGTAWAPQVLIVILAVTGFYGVGAAVAMVALLRRMAQRHPTRDEALVAWFMLGPALIAAAGLLVLTTLR